MNHLTSLCCGNNPSPAGPGEYTIKELLDLVSLGAIGDCTGEGLFSTMATGEIESGQTAAHLGMFN